MVARSGRVGLLIGEVVGRRDEGGVEEMGGKEWAIVTCDVVVDVGAESDVSRAGDVGTFLSRLEALYNLLRGYIPAPAGTLRSSSKSPFKAFRRLSSMLGPRCL